MNPVPQTFATRDLQRNYRSIVDMAKKSREPVVLINNSAPEAVLMDVGTYNLLVNDDYVWDEDFVLERVAAADRSSRSGKSVRIESWDDLD
jgi:PHD/YefM family antitoxin component YafN of YafNO toxin-antitoxin module